MGNIYSIKSYIGKGTTNIKFNRNIVNQIGGIRIKIMYFIMAKDIFCLVYMREMNGKVL
jgi:hypothetical protein